MQWVVDPLPGETVMESDFAPLRVSFCSHSGVNSTHTVHYKTHRVRVNSELTPNDRTLFSLGWPPYCSKSAIKELFSRAGHVAEVYLQTSPGAVEDNERNDALLQGQPKGFQVMYKLVHGFLLFFLCNPG